MKLDSAFVAPYRKKSPFKDGLGQFVFARTYSRNGETWADVCERVVNGMYWLQEIHPDKHDWNEEKAQRSAREAFDLMFDMKWTPPGRGLWMMGTEFVEGRQITEALQNCSFVSSAFIGKEKGDFFRWLMDMSMLGVGVGFDTKGAGKVEIVKPGPAEFRYVVEDNRESWAKSVHYLFNSYLGGPSHVVFDYSKIRAVGEPIKGFGGTAAGSEPLRRLHDDMRAVLDNRIGQKITSRDIVDIANMIGRCVVAGNVRRSAEIALGFADDSEFIDLKNYAQNPDRADYGWVSNNSVFAVPGSTDYRGLAERTWDNGEPGYVWLPNARNYARMNGIVDRRDADALGVNPCAEQILGHREMCTLVEIYLPHIRNKTELTKVVKYAYLYGKSVTLGNAFIRDEKSREIMEANRRIGLSMTGIAQFLAKHGMDTLKNWMRYAYEMTEYYDQLYSQWLGVPQSVRRTSVKPSGTVSLMAGVTPGIHFPIAQTYIRRINVAANSTLVGRLENAGYPVVPSVVDPSGTVVVEFPVDLGEGVRTEQEVPIREQLELAAVAQRNWADNSVSITAKFDKKVTTPQDISELLEEYQHRLKAVSLLPLDDHNYEQAPYEAISREEYGRRVEGLKKLNLGEVEEEDRYADLFCTTDVCEVVQ